MKFLKFLRLSVASALVFSIFSPFAAPAFAQTPIVTITARSTPISKFNYLDRSKTMNVKDFFTVVFEAISAYEGVPKSSSYVRLEYLNVIPGTELYAAMQKGVYLDLVENTKTSLPLRKTASEGLFVKILERATGEKIDGDSKKPLTYGVMFDTLSDLYDDNGAVAESVGQIENTPNFGVLNDVYKKLREEYYDPTKTGEDDLVRGAAKGLAEATGDKHTVYFPPTESRQFQDEMSGEFEGIGAYVEMQTAGILKIVAPISGSPSERAGIKAGDVITKVGELVIDDTVSLEYAVSKIKGPAGTEALLEIKRGTETLKISVKREKITVKYVEFKKLDDGVPYVKITMFGEGVLASFDEAAKWIAKNGTDTDKLVIDLRNNPGGSLDEVAAILSYFVPKGEDVVKIRYRDSKGSIASTGSDSPLSGRKIAILINEGSASASEIMAGTVKDYLPKTVLVGAKTYGKGSVQNFVPYSDGSSIKYTIAKWFTGKSDTGIDGVGIQPDITIVEATGSTVDAGLNAAREALRNR